MVFIKQKPTSALKQETNQVTGSICIPHGMYSTTNRGTCTCTLYMYMYIVHVAEYQNVLSICHSSSLSLLNNTVHT